eukprot:c18373_g1_i1.p1 GENE.c18373_g1_i1~~c18373_g1_i1.p1  ORF type:complete len:189 (+),score=41.62 c18373_g1_i1:59-625(+)
MATTPGTTTTNPHAFRELLSLVWNCDISNIERILVKNPSLVTTQDWYQCTALHYAGMRGNVQIINLLLSHGASPNSQDCFGCTPLMFAIFENQFEAVKCFVKQGADLTIRSRKDNKTALDYCTSKGHRNLAAVIVQEMRKIRLRTFLLGTRQTPLKIESKKPSLVLLLPQDLLGMIASHVCDDSSPVM